MATSLGKTYPVVVLLFKTSVLSEKMFCDAFSFLPGFYVGTLNLIA